MFANTGFLKYVSKQPIQYVFLLTDTKCKQGVATLKGYLRTKCLSMINSFFVSRRLPYKHVILMAAEVARALTQLCERVALISCGQPKNFLFGLIGIKPHS